MSLDYFTKDYLLSDDYVNDMMVNTDMSYDDYIKFLFDAEPSTFNYVYRHNPKASDISKKLGGWRWKGLFTYRKEIVPILYDNNLKGVDFGGSQRPISNHLDIVDLEQKDYYNRPIKYNSLKQIEGELDFIFSSHTLEHIPNLEEILDDMFQSLKNGGKLILNLPSYTCKRWRADSGQDMGGTLHVHTFKLSKTELTDNIKHLINIDSLLKDKGFNIEVSEYTGDNSIIVICKK